MRVLSLAHECNPEFDFGLHRWTYRGSSPDEVTLVNWASE